MFLHKSHTYFFWKIVILYKQTKGSILISLNAGHSTMQSTFVEFFYIDVTCGEMPSLQCDNQSVNLVQTTHGALWIVGIVDFVHRPGV